MSLLRLRVVDRARIDLAAIHAWLTQPGSGRRGHGRYLNILKAMSDLRSAPLRWPVGDTPEVRERPIEGHRIYYRIDRDIGLIEILRIFAPYQDRV